MKYFSLLFFVFVVCIFGIPSLVLANDIDISPIEEINNMPWIKGPTRINIGNNTMIDLPSGYEVLDPKYAHRFIQLQGNPPGESEYYILQPISSDADWFAVMQYVDSGHISDNDNIDADKILLEAKEYDIRSNKIRLSEGYGPLYTKDWRMKPTYDIASHRLEWAFLMNDDKSTFSNLKTRILSRTGYLDILMVGDDKKIVEDSNELNDVINHIYYINNEKYSDYRDGDRLATYGIIGLITGSTVALAVKTGLFAAVTGFLAKIFSGVALKGGVIIALAFFVGIINKVKSLFSSKNK